MKISKLLFVIFSVLLLVACSSSVEVVKKSESNKNEKAAMDHFLKGSISESKGQLAEAILEYQDALRYDTSAGIYYSLGKAYYKLNKFSNALEHAKMAAKLEPKNLDYQQLIATIYTASHNYDSAIVVYNHILSMDSTNTEAMYNLGRLYKYDQPLKALKIFNKALDLVGPNWSLLVEVAELNERLGNVNETISTIEKLLEINPSELKLTKILIQSYIKAGRLEEALELTDRSLTTFPDDISLIEYKANILLAQDKKNEAAEEFKKLFDTGKIPYDGKLKIASLFLSNEKDSSNIEIAKDLFNAIAKDSSDWQLNVYLGELAIQEGNDSVGVEYLKSAAKDAPWNVQIWSRLADRLFYLGKTEEIISELSPVIEDFPDNFFLHLVLGLSYSYTGVDSSAEKYLMKAVELNPNDAIALSSIGYTLNRLNKNDDALYYLNRAKKINPDDVQVWSLLGIIYNSKKDFENGDKAYRKALELDSLNALVLNNYAYSLVERGIRIDEAYEMSKKSLELDPENSSYLDTFGWILYKMGKYGEAKKYISDAIEKEPDNPTLLDHLGDVYNKLNDQQKAIEYWQKALSQDTDNESIRKKIEEAQQ